MKQGVLLAAGFSRRFDVGNKLLHPLDDGTPMILAAAHSLCSALSNVLVVVNSEAEELQQLLLRNGYSITVCPNAHQGMGASLAWAVREASGATAWVIALGDMPLIKPNTHRRVADSLDESWDIAAPVFQGRRGHPVGFGGAYREALLTLKGDQGARSLLHDHKERLKLLDCKDKGVLLDIDTTDNLNSLSVS